MATLQITSDELRAIRNDAKQEALMIAQGEFPDQSINQPGESGPYQDKTTHKKPKTEGQKLEESGDYIDTGEGTDSAGNPLMIKGDMPPDVNTPWLPGGQSTEGIPNVDNPKLKEVLKKRKGIKQQNPNLDIPDFLKNIDGFYTVFFYDFRN